MQADHLSLSIESLLVSLILDWLEFEQALPIFKGWKQSSPTPISGNGENHIESKVSGLGDLFTVTNKWLQNHISQCDSWYPECTAKWGHHTALY